MTTALSSPAFSRRQVLKIAAASPLAALEVESRSARAQAEQVQRLRLRLAPAKARLAGESWPETGVWAYDGSVPGPVLWVRQGAPVEVTVENGLAEDTTVHWHGIRLPNAMDGVPGLTQPPIKPGETFTYAFTPPDAGTFWYHPHVDSLRQLGRGLAGALLVEEPHPIAVDRDLLWVIQDWRLDERAQVAGGFGNRMEASMSGRVGNTVTINGRVPEPISVRGGERLRRATSAD